MAKNEKINFDNKGEKVVTGGSAGSIKIMPGQSVTIKSGHVIGGNKVNSDQTFTNTSDSAMKLVHNDEADIFELKPMGDAEDLS